MPLPHEKMARHILIWFWNKQSPTFVHTRTLNIYHNELTTHNYAHVPSVPNEPTEPTDSTDSTDSMTIIIARIQIIIKILARSALISTPQEWQYRCCFSCYRVVPVVWQNPFHQFHISKFLRKQALRHSKVQLCEIIKTSNANIVH